MRLVLLALCVVLTLLVAILPFPLGIPGEWTWERYPDAPTLGSWVAPVLAGLVVVAVMLAGARRIPRAGRVAIAGWLTALVAAAFAWLWVVQEEVPSPVHGLAKAAWVLYYPGPSGYFTEARRTASERFVTLQNYTSTLKKGDVLHQGTHPPGLIVAYWGLMDVSRLGPVAAIADRTQPESVRRGFDEILIEQRKRHSPTPLTQHDRRVLWLAMLLVQLTAAMTVAPLYALVRLDHDAETSWWTASPWAGVPAVAIFLPKSDVLLAFVGLLALLCWALAVRSATWPGRILAAASAGIAFWLGLCISLAMLPVGFAAAVLAGWDVWTASADRRQRLGHIAILAATTLAVLCIAVAIAWLATGLNLFEVWAWNYRNHAAFYAQFPRTWSKWLLVNPVELAVAAGLPLAALVVLGWLSRGTANDFGFWILDFGFSRRESLDQVQELPTDLNPKSKIENPKSPPLALPLALMVTWLVLWLSGKNSGEAARLWIFLMPWLCVLCARAIGQAVSRNDRALPVAALVCQLACSAILTLHVSGFLSGVPAARADSPVPAAANR